MAARFDVAASKAQSDEGLKKYLRSPNREIIVHNPVAMGKGQLKVLDGYRVQHSNAERANLLQSRRTSGVILSMEWVSSELGVFVEGWPWKRDSTLPRRSSLINPLGLTHSAGFPKEGRKQKCRLHTSNSPD
jgi:hypothetical protein